MGHVGKRVFDIVLVIKDFVLPVRVDEQVARREKVGDDEQIGRQARRQNVETYGPTLGRVVLVCRVVLSGIVDISTPVAAANLSPKRVSKMTQHCLARSSRDTYDDDGAVFERFECRIPSAGRHVVGSVVCPFARLVRAHVQCPRRLASVAVLVRVRSRRDGQATVRDTLVSTNVDPCAVAEYVAACTERVCDNVHRADLVRVGIIPVRQN